MMIFRIGSGGWVVVGIYTKKVSIIIRRWSQIFTVCNKPPRFDIYILFILILLHN